MLPFQRDAEGEFRRILESDQAAENYARMPDTHGGKILGVDQARNLFAGYAESRQGRMRHLDSTTAPASEWVDRRYREMLEAEPTGDVIFMAGGSGSGKTTTSLGALSRLVDSAEIVVDGTLQSRRKAEKNIKRAIASGRQALVVFVHRPIADAASAVASRFTQTGRLVPSRAVIENHPASRRAFLLLSESFATNENVAFKAYDNSGETPAEIGVDELRRVDDTARRESEGTRAEVESRLREVEAEYRAEVERFAHHHAGAAGAVQADGGAV